MSNTFAWQAVGQALENLGTELKAECEIASAYCEDDEEFQQLYVNYVQLLESIKVQHVVIGNRFDELNLTNPRGVV